MTFITKFYRSGLKVATVEKRKYSGSEKCIGEISGSHDGEYEGMSITVFWVVAPCGLVEIGRRFRGT
jgi:hypothetical protein